MNKKGGLLAARHRRKDSKLTHEDPGEDDGTQVERRSSHQAKKHKSKRALVKTDDKFDNALREFAQDQLKLGVPALCEEFTKIKIDTQFPVKALRTAFDANQAKNRYKDVYCLDQTRVVLKFPDDKTADDYIHANWVHIPEKNRFICTQAPTEGTIEDFWRMIWQERCRSILMLCNLVEQGKKKCEQYWPVDSGEVMELNCLKIKKLSSSNIEDLFTQTKLEISDEKHADKTFTVEHIAWNNWPDRGVPTNLLASMRLIQRVKTLTPIVVHCSAGIGRTGTIVGIDVIRDRLQNGTSCTLEKVVRELREMRHGSVQMDIQYVYMARVLLALAENRKLITKTDLAPWLADYETLCKARGC